MFRDLLTSPELNSELIYIYFMSSKGAFQEQQFGG